MGGTHTHTHTWAAALPCRADVWDDMMKKDVHYIILLYLISCKKGVNFTMMMMMMREYGSTKQKKKKYMYGDE